MRRPKWRGARQGKCWAAARPTRQPCKRCWTLRLRGWVAAWRCSTAPRMDASTGSTPRCNPCMTLQARCTASWKSVPTSRHASRPPPKPRARRLRCTAPSKPSTKPLCCSTPKTGWSCATTGTGRSTRALPTSSFRALASKTWCARTPNAETMRARMAGPRNGWPSAWRPTGPPIPPWCKPCRMAARCASSSAAWPTATRWASASTSRTS